VEDTGREKQNGRTKKGHNHIKKRGIKRSMIKSTSNYLPTRKDRTIPHPPNSSPTEEHC